MPAILIFCHPEVGSVGATPIAHRPTPNAPAPIDRQFAGDYVALLPATRETWMRLRGYGYRAYVISFHNGHCCRTAN